MRFHLGQSAQRQGLNKVTKNEKRGDHQEEKGEVSASKLQGMAMFEEQRLWEASPSARLSSEGRTEALRSSGFFFFLCKLFLLPLVQNISNLADSQDVRRF